MDSTSKCTINGVDFVPKSLEPLIADIHLETGRTADGVLHTNRVRANVRKYSITMPPMSSAAIAPYLTALQAETFTASIPDPLSGTYSGTFYCSDRNVPVYNFALDLWDAWDFSIVEV